MCYRWSILYSYCICIPGFDNCDTTLCSVTFHRVGDGDITVDLVHTRRPGRKPFWWWKSEPGLLWPESQTCRQLFHLQQRQLGNRQVASRLSFQQVPCSVSLSDSFAELRDGGIKQIKLRSPLREMLLFGWLNFTFDSQYTTGAINISNTLQLYEKARSLKLPYRALWMTDYVGLTLKESQSKNLLFSVLLGKCLRFLLWNS